MKPFQNRTIGFWCGENAALLMLISDVAFAVLDHGDRTFSWFTFGMILAGVVFRFLVLVSDFSVFPLLSAVCFGTGLAWHLYLGLPTASDVVNGVNFVGGNFMMFLIFGIIFLVGTVMAIIACFTKQRSDT